MNRLQTWMLTIAFACFGAGIATGTAVPRVIATGQAHHQDNPDEPYVQDLAKRLNLDQDQLRLLRKVHLAFRKDTYDMAIRLQSKWPAEMRSQLQTFNRKKALRVRALLTPEQRERYDQIIGQTPLPK